MGSRPRRRVLRYRRESDQSHSPYSEQVLERKTADQVFGLEDVVHLAWGQDEADGIAEGIDTNVDLRTQAAARTPDRLIFAPPFFAPAAC